MDNLNELIEQKAVEYADRQLDQTLPLAQQVILKNFNWADIAKAFELGAKWMASLPYENTEQL